MRDKVVITRPSPGLEETAQAVEALGFYPLLAPLQVFDELFSVPHSLMENCITPQHISCADEKGMKVFTPSAMRAMEREGVSLEEKTALVQLFLTIFGICGQLRAVQAIILTSRQAVRSLKRVWPQGVEQNIPVLVVGDKTGQEAKEAGFTHIESASGTADDLAALCRARLAPSNGAVLLACGLGEAAGLATAMRQLGFVFLLCPLYYARPLSVLPGKLCSALAEGSIHSVLFFSQKAVKNFMTLIKAVPESEVLESDTAGSEGSFTKKTASLVGNAVTGASYMISSYEDFLAGINAVVISDRVKSAVEPYLWKQVVVAPYPTALSVIQSLETLRYK